MKKWLTLALGPAISVAIIYVLIGDDLGAVHDELTQARYVYLLPAGGLLVAGLLTRAMRWHVLTDQRLSIWHSFHILNVGYFLSSLVPLRLGDVARAYMTTRLEPPVAAFTAISTIVIERLLDLLALIAMIGLMLLLLDVPSEVTSAGAVVSMMALLASLALAALALKPAWALTVLRWMLQRFPLLERFDLQARLQHFIEGVQPMGQPRIAVGALLWTVVSWAFSLAAGYIILFMLFDSPTLAATVSLIVLATLSVALPAVPGNLGPFEGAVVGGLWIGGMVASASPPENAPAVALGVVLHALTLAIYITLGLVGLVVEHASVRQITHGAKSFAEESSTEASAQPRSIAQESVS